MRGFWRRAGAPALVALMIAGVAAWACYWSTRVYTDATPAAEESVRHKIEAALPLGATRKDVEAWLASQGLKGATIHSVPDGRFVGLGVETRFTPNDLLGGHQNLYMEFSFNSDGKLTDLFVRIQSISS